MGATNKVFHLYFCIFCAVFTVSGPLKWPQNLASLELVFNKLGLLWQPHWLCVLYWTFTANFTPPHTLQYEISCWHIPCWWPAYQHQNTTYAGLTGLCCFFQKGDQIHVPTQIKFPLLPPPAKSHSELSWKLESPHHIILHRIKSHCVKSNRTVLQCIAVGGRIFPYQWLCHMNPKRIVSLAVYWDGYRITSGLKMHIPTENQSGPAMSLSSHDWCFLLYLAVSWYAKFGPMKR